MAFIAALGQKEPGPEAGLTTLGASSSSSAYSTYTVGGGHEFAHGDFPQQQQQLQHQREFQIVHRHNMAQGERPQSHHFALSTTEDVKPSTHDFLSLYDKGSQHVDHSSGPGLSSSLTTHDFLQPLERGGARGAYRDTPPPRSEKFSSRDRDNAQSRTGAAVLMDRLPPTAIPNYATIQVPYGRSNGVMEVPPNSVIRMVGDAEALRTRGYPLATLSSREDHSGGGGEGLRGVEVDVDTDSVNARGFAENVAYWPGVRFKFGLPPDLTFPASTTAQSGTENGHQPSPVTTKQRTQGTQGTIEAAKRPTRPPSEEDEDEDEDSQERPRGNRKETLYQKGEAGQKMDSKNTESMRGGTPRSKHSATEQRRRSKINDRFQMLRDLVPHSDQKRDKASFLLEVIDYIQILQEKVRKYETAEQGRHQERLKSMVWDICKRGAGSEDEASQINALVFAKEFSPGVPLDVKQVTAVAADLTRSRAQLPSDHATTPSELHSTGVHNIQNASNRPASSIHSCVSSLEAEKENATALMAQPVAVGVPAQQAMALPYALPLLQPKQQQHHHDQVYVRGLPTSNSPKRSNLSDTTEPQNLRVNGHHHSGQAQANSSLEHQFEVRLRPSTAHESDQQQASGQFSKMEPHVQSVSKFVGKVDGAQVGGSPRHPQSSTQESQDNALRNGRHSQAKQTDDPAVREEHGASPRKAEAPMSIQGGVINVSTIYSQGLLDTLTKALQSSGLDLSRANISVQIDLGKNATIAAVDTSAKVATTPESSAQSHQSQGRTRASPMATGPEPPLKKPKLESQH